MKNNCKVNVRNPSVNILGFSQLNRFLQGEADLSTDRQKILASHPLAKVRGVFPASPIMKPVNWGWLFFILTGLLLFASQQPIPVEAQAVVNPERIEVTLEPGQCVEKNISVTTGEAPIPKLDVVFVFDVTLSMEDVIDEVTQSAEQIAADIRKLVPDVAFALATTADYPSPERDRGIYPWRLDQDFTPDIGQIETALDQLKLYGSADIPESYLRALHEIQFLNWRPESRRIVILFGDAFPHDPDPGRDEKIGTNDDLTQSKVIKQLIGADITILALHSTEDMNAQSILKAQSFYEDITDETEGRAFRLDRVDRIPEVVQELILEAISRVRFMTLNSTPPGDAWLQWQPDFYQDVDSQTEHNFGLNLCVPADTSSGEYTFDLSVLGDGATIGQVIIVVTIPPRADLAISQAGGQEPVTVGSNLSYKLTVVNKGPDNATDVTVDDTLPQNITFVSATPDQGSCSETEGNKVRCNLGNLSVNQTVTVETIVRPISEGDLINEAVVRSTELDPDLTNNRSSGATEVGATADLVVTQTDIPDPVAAGESWIYKIVASNQGPSEAAEVQLISTLPQGVSFSVNVPSQGNCRESGNTVTCNLGNMISNGNATLEIEVVAIEGGDFANTVNLSSSVPDPNLANNSVTENTSVGSTADVSIVMSDSPDPIAVGQVTTYTLTIANNGLSTAVGVILTDTLPGGVTIASHIPSQGSCSQTGGSINCILNDLGSGVSATVQISIMSQAEGNLSNQANVASSVLDSDLTNNIATEITTVESVGWPWWWWCLPLLLILLLLLLWLLFRRRREPPPSRPKSGRPAHVSSSGSSSSRVPPKKRPGITHGRR